MTFADLLVPEEAGLTIVERIGNLNIPVTDLTDDSRRVLPGTVFVAVKGERVDGHRFLPEAMAAGAAALVTQARPGALPGAGMPVDATVPVATVVDSRSALGVLAGRLFGNPSVHLRMIGVTGTNGKTTVTYLCKGMLEAAGRHVGLVGTVGYLVGSERLSASHTTPGSVDLQRLLGKMVGAGLDSAVMEVSSHALASDRTSGCEFDVAIFTNLTQDHLDFHGSMEEYFRAKLRLFTGLGSGAKKSCPKRALINIDDPRGGAVSRACTVPVWTYAIDDRADIRAESVQLSLAGTSFRVAGPAGSFIVESRLVGRHNVYNLLAAVGVGLHEGLSHEEIASGLGTVATVPGRFERVEAGQNFTVVVDYAHTEDALDRLLSAAQTLKTGRIITVFGCGGDRDRGKRPKMGRVAALKSDLVFLTSDNPRTEDPAAILAEVEAGIRAVTSSGPCRYEVIADRRSAIEAAIKAARPGDTVLIAGKGHEDYQIIGVTRLPFDDRQVAREAIQKLC
jgi:UDP-N-acetylmuramoyl-L-alanyl-D-glutamate--2,6-diaminopimelate ligase